MIDKTIHGRVVLWSNNMGLLPQKGAYHDVVVEHQIQSSHMQFSEIQPD